MDDSATLWSSDTCKVDARRKRCIVPVRYLISFSPNRHRSPSDPILYSELMHSLSLFCLF